MTSAGGRPSGDIFRLTLQRHILERQRRHARATGELSTVLMQLAHAAKVFGHALATAALDNQLGPTGETNVQGEATQKLDLFGNHAIREAFVRSELVAAIVSEEDDQPTEVACGPRAKYILGIDPLDGSSNSGVNGAVGTIFGIYRPAHATGRQATARDLRSGRDIIAAGYVLYGPSTLFVYAAGDGLDGFTLDRDIGEFLLTHPRIHCPERGKYYSANVGRSAEWPAEFRAFTDALTTGDDAHSFRYSGALVADLHRNLLEGGVYLYPPDREHPDGKLRLLYECAPLAFVIEEAGGAASTGMSRVLDVPISSIHQRVPLVIGSRLDVARLEEFLRR
jgi:fructose-1,6-bisphosphatase I